MRIPKLRRVIAGAVTVGVVGVGTAVAAAPAQAYTGSPGTHELCSAGTYATVVAFRNSGGMTSLVAPRGQCAPFPWFNNSVVDIYGFYPGGSKFYIGTDWWSCNITTYGNMGPGGYHWYQSGCTG